MANTAGGVGAKHALWIVATIAAFLSIGPSLMLLNKHIMQAHRFPYPMSLSVLGLLTSAVFSHSVVAAGICQVRPESADVVAGCKWVRTALPVGAAKAVTLATGNAVYLHLGLGFIQMLKAFTPAIVLTVMAALGVKRPARAAVWFVFVIIIGTLTEVHGELNLTAVGLALMLTSELMEATGLVLTQKLLQDSKFSVIEGLYFLAPPGALCLTIVAAATEWPAMVKEGRLEEVRAHPWDFAAAAGLGLGVNFVGMQLVQATSSLFCKILNVVRCVALVVVGALFYGEMLAPIELAGYAISLVGFAGYNYVQVFPQEAARLERVVDTCSCVGVANKESQHRGRYLEARSCADEEGADEERAYLVAESAGDHSKDANMGRWPNQPSVVGSGKCFEDSPSPPSLRSSGAEGQLSLSAWELGLLKRSADRSL